MDEPFSALDELTRGQLQDDLLQLWNRERKTILFVTHNISEAIYLADRVVVMSPHPGRIKTICHRVCPGPAPKNCKKHPSSLVGHGAPARRCDHERRGQHSELSARRRTAAAAHSRGGR